MHDLLANNPCSMPVCTNVFHQECVLFVLCFVFGILCFVVEAEDVSRDGVEIMIADGWILDTEFSGTGRAILEAQGARLILRAKRFTHRMAKTRQTLGGCMAWSSSQLLEMRGP